MAQCSALPDNGGLVDIPVGLCLAVLGKALCDQESSPKGSASTAGNSTEPLISVPVSVCAAVIGEVQCEQEASSTGLVDIPVDACIAVRKSVSKPSPIMR